MPSKPIEALLQLKNIGPKSVPQLIEIGIKSRENLIALGTEEAFRRLYFRFCDEHRFSVNYLYALEGAINDCDWRWISPKRKEELREVLRELKETDVSK